MESELKAILLVSVLISIAMADQRTDAKINSVSIAGENQLIINLASPGNPTPMDLYVIVGLGPNGIPATNGDLKQYHAIFLAAHATGSKVDVLFDLGPPPEYKPLARQVTLKN